MQQDGNFVVYNSGGAVQWASGTSSSNSYVRLQADGNLVVYTPGGSAVWSSATSPSSGNTLVMQDDGNLVLYSGSRALWSSNGGKTPSAGSSSGYPDDDAVACGSSAWCKGGSSMSARRFGYRNCTDYVAWRLGYVWSQIQAGGDGNARAWKQGWLNRGRSVGTTPRVGAVAWWGSNRGAGWGHVAVVIALNPDGSARVAQYNAGFNGAYSESSEKAEAYLY